VLAGVLELVGLLLDPRLGGLLGVLLVLGGASWAEQQKQPDRQEDAAERSPCAELLERRHAIPSRRAESTKPPRVPAFAGSGNGQECDSPFPVINEDAGTPPLVRPRLGSQFTQRAPLTAEAGPSWAAGCRRGRLDHPVRPGSQARQAHRVPRGTRSRPARAP